MTTATGLILNQTIEQLEKNNKTLEQWQNYDDFVDVLKENVENVKFRGLGAQINDELGWNTDQGATAFYQVQTQGTIQDRNAVAIFYPKQGLVWGPNEIEWNTVNGKPPLDRVVIERQIQPQIGRTASTIILSFGTGLAMLVFGFIVFTLKRRLAMLESMPQLQMAILIGTLLISLSTLVISLEPWFQMEPHGLCMSSIILLIFGLALILLAITAKLRIAMKTPQFSKSVSLKASPSKLATELSSSSS